MNEKKIYTMRDGNKYYSDVSIVFNNKMFLLLYDIKNDTPAVAIEENGKLKFVKEDFDGYQDILGLLADKMNSNL